LRAPLVWRIDRTFRKSGRPSLKAEELQFGFENGKLTILIDILGADDLEILNADKSLKSETAKLLKEVARYEGDFVFEGDFPF
jgi:hypothetical protein